MNLWCIATLLGLCWAHINLGSMDGFLTFAEISQTMDNLNNSYPNLFTRTTSSGFDTLILRNSSGSDLIANRPVILVLGGFYAGYPMGNFMTLQVADELADLFTSGDDEAAQILSVFDVHFIPNLNPKAYLYMESNYNGKDFLVVQTDLSGNATSCPGAYDVGVDAYFNFPYEFVASDDKCSPNYPGIINTWAQISGNLYSYYFNSTTVGIPCLIINFQGTGGFYYYPFATSGRAVDSNTAEYYEDIEHHGYTVGSYFNVTGNVLNGTFMDYAYSMGSNYFEIALGASANVSQGSIYDLADDHYDNIQYFMTRMIPDMSFDFLLDDYVETECSDLSCNYYSQVLFEVKCYNENYATYNYTAIFNANFQNWTSMIPINVTSKTIYINNSVSYEILNFNSYSVNDSTSVVFSGYVPGYSEVKLYITYERPNEEISTDTSQTPSVAFTSNNLNLPPFTAKLVDNLGGGIARGNVVGLVLLIVLLVLFAIAAVSLHCMRKARQAELPARDVGQRA